MNKSKPQNNNWYRVGIILLISGLLIALFFFLKPMIEEEFNSNPKSWDLDFSQKEVQDALTSHTDSEPEFRHPITGEAQEEKQEFFPIGIIIDNHIDARPAHGLDKADLVYEAEVEAGITRYVAIFDSKQDIDKIGPVRSARPYFIDWVQEFSGLFVHCGGSPQALMDIVEENVFDLNEFYKSKYFWTEEDLAKPHNIFTNMENITDYIDTQEVDPPNFFSWEFEDKESPEQITDQEVRVDYKSGYEVKWVYNKKQGEYIRYLDGDKHKTAQGNVITADNIVLHKTQTEVIDEKLRLDMKTSGEGEAIICSQGECVSGEWKKNTDYSRTRYFNQHGLKYKFTPGQTWIEIIDRDIDYTID